MMWRLLGTFAGFILSFATLPVVATTPASSNWHYSPITVVPVSPTVGLPTHAEGRHLDTVSVLQSGIEIHSNSIDTRIAGNGTKHEGVTQLGNEKEVTVAHGAATQAMFIPQQRDVSWGKRYALLVQRLGCAHGETSADPCLPETSHAIILLVALSLTICLIFCAFFFFREDKEESIVPLCPQLYVISKDLNFSIPEITQANDMEVIDVDMNEPLCKVELEWKDPNHPDAKGIACTIRIMNNKDAKLAELKYNVAETRITISKIGAEIFGFIVPETKNRFHVKHRTGVHLLTLRGDFVNLDISGINQVGCTVFTFKPMSGKEWIGNVVQNVDAGLVILCILAMHVHHRLMIAPPQPHGSLNQKPGSSEEDSSSYGHNSRSASGFEKLGPEVRNPAVEATSPRQAPSPTQSITPALSMRSSMGFAHFASESENPVLVPSRAPSICSAFGAQFASQDFENSEPRPKNMLRRPLIGNPVSALSPHSAAQKDSRGFAT